MTTTREHRRANSPTDHDLHADLVAGDPRAASVLYQRHFPTVRGTCISVVKDRHLADDVAQEVFFEFFRKPGRADPTLSPVGAYLCMMARRRSVDAVRSLESSRRREARSVAESYETPTTPEVGSELVAEADRRSVNAAVARLPEAHRLAIKLAFYQGHTYRQVASVLDIPEGTAKSRLRSALHQLGDDEELLRGVGRAAGVS